MLSNEILEALKLQTYNSINFSISVVDLQASVLAKVVFTLTNCWPQKTKIDNEPLLDIEILSLVRVKVSLDFTPYVGLCNSCEVVMNTFSYPHYWTVESRSKQKSDGVWLFFMRNPYSIRKPFQCFYICRCFIGPHFSLLSFLLPATVSEAHISLNIAQRRLKWVEISKVIIILCCLHLEHKIVHIRTKGVRLMKTKAKPKNVRNPGAGV